MRGLIFLLSINLLILLFSDKVKAQNGQAVVNGSPTLPVSFPAGNGSCTYKWVNNTPGIGLAASGAGNIPAFTAVNNGTTPVTATITATLTSPSYAYIVCGSGNVSVINTLTNAVVATITVPQIPESVSVSPDGSRAYVASFDGSISVIDVATNKVVNTVHLSQSPIPQEAAAIVVSPDGSKVYAGIYAYSQTVQVIDAASNTVTGSIPVGFGVGSLAISPDGSRLYVSNQLDYNISVVNTATNKIIGTIKTGTVPNDVRVSPDGNNIYVANIGDNTVTIYSAATYKLLKTINTDTGPNGLALSPDGKELYVTNSSGTVQVINTTAYDITATIPVGSIPEGISVTADGKWVYVANHNSNDVSVIDAATNQVVTTVPVSDGPEAYGNFISQGPGCSAAPVTYTITVYPNADPFITVTGTPEPLQTVYGQPSASTVFTVLGSNISGGILVTAPPGFEVSTNNVDFTSTITLPARGVSEATPIYCRLAATTPAGPVSGSLTLSSAGATTVSSEIINGVVNKAPLTIAADNKTRKYGENNPVFTASYTGFVNNDRAEQLTTQPTFTTIATKLSDPGQYDIDLSGAASPNYFITPVSGILTILKGEINIPNAFTPNGDGINDQWNIENIGAYTNCTVYVYNRLGQKVYASSGYGIPWDGTRNGSELPAGVYYYIIDLGKSSNLLSGYVTIIR